MRSWFFMIIFCEIRKSDRFLQALANFGILFYKNTHETIEHSELHFNHQASFDIWRSTTNAPIHEHTTQQRQAVRAIVVAKHHREGAGIHTRFYPRKDTYTGIQLLNPESTYCAKCRQTSSSGADKIGVWPPTVWTWLVMRLSAATS